MANRGGHESTSDEGILYLWHSLPANVQKQYLESVKADIGQGETDKNKEHTTEKGRDIYIGNLNAKHVSLGNNAQHAGRDINKITLEPEKKKARWGRVKTIASIITFLILILTFLIGDNVCSRLKPKPNNINPSIPQIETPKTEVKTSGDSSNYGRAEDVAGLIRIIPNVADSNINGVLSDLHQKQDLRKLTPLETGKKISETALGTYFYVFPAYLDFAEEGRDERIGPAIVDSLGYLGYFELQKHTNGNICLLGYVSSESGAKISGPLGKTETDIVACAQPWREFNNIAVIPVSRISKCTYREITITEGRSMKVLDLRIK